jgi:hypothetical protein
MRTAQVAMQEATEVLVSLEKMLEAERALSSSALRAALGFSDLVGEDLSQAEMEALEGLRGQLADVLAVRSEWQ